MNLKHSMLALALLFGATAAHAEINTIDNVPAATLLAPYFDIDLANANGVRTTLTIGNSTATERLAHVTLWTDMGVPSMNFDVRLDARDTVDIDLRALFASGTLPASTAGGFGSCGAFLPPSTLAAGMLTGLRNAHTGAASTLFSGQCGGSVQGDGHARGFVTIDVVSGCSTLFPGDPGYFTNGGTGTARNDNVLWGEMVVSNPSIGVTYGDALVHIEADATDALTDGTPVLINHDNNAMTPDVNFDDYTFYARMGATSGADNREALALNYMARFELGGASAMETHALVWRDPGDASTFACGSPPTAPIGKAQFFAIDHQEEPAAEPAAALPLATQSVDLGDAGAVSVPFNKGVMAYGLGLDTDTGPGLFTRNQGYVAHVITAPGTASSVSRGWPVITADSRFNLVYPVGFPQCSDGVDNDSDGDIDFPDDAQCASPSGVESTQCSNGIDEDGDMLIDFPADPDCRSALDDREIPMYDNQCSDGIDNDGDGLIDWPADPLCNHPNDLTEANQCGDGIDNDMDGLIDFPSDPGCDSVTDNIEQSPACNDGVDNDMDGVIDFPADAGCTSLNDGNETNAFCNDGIDNDMDGNIDFPADTGCTSLDDGDETNAICNDGIDNDMDGSTDFPADVGCQTAEWYTESPQCSDGSDNDGDMTTDFPADNSCAAAWSDTEVTQCSDGTDNFDGDGLIDFPADPECLSPTDNTEYSVPECNDDIDNDGDGQIDYPDDTNCTSNGDYFESPAECSDGIDNDGDGDIDFPNSSSCSSPEDRDEAPDCSDNEYDGDFPNATPADNDRDGLANFGSDPGCASALDLNELGGSTTRSCNDGIDNDADGFIDFPEDPGCSSAYDDVEYAPGQSIRAPLEPFHPVPTLSHVGLALMAGLFALLALFGLRRERHAGE